MLKKLPNGINFIEVSYDDMTLRLNGLAICDSCAAFKKMKNGFLIPVLNSVYCKDCFSEWKQRVEFYPEDVEYEAEKTQIFLKALKKIPCRTQ